MDDHGINQGGGLPENPVEKWIAALKEKKLLLQLCNKCNEYQFYPRLLCAKCGCSDLKWKESSGTGTVYTFTEVHKAPSPAFESLVPYTIALVELMEGVRIMSWIRHEKSENVSVGSAVRAVFEISPLGMAVPIFRLSA